MFCSKCGSENATDSAFCSVCGAPLSHTDGGSSTSPGSDLSGTEIGDYLLVRKLGQGGMGTVYEGRHTTIEQRVAIKVLAKELAGDEYAQSRFRLEGSIQASHTHPNIVRVLTATSKGGQTAMVMEHVEGLSLDRVLENRGRLPLEEALHLFRQVIDAVGFAHDHGVIHRDIKPSNIMVMADGTAKVMDFGIAKQAGGKRLTRTGATLGTPLYMSPEQVIGARDVDHRTDVYSLGVALYEALTGQTPFEGMDAETTDSDFLIKRAIVDDVPPDARTLVPNLPSQIAEALIKAMAKQPATRFSDCESFGQAVGEVPPPPVHLDKPRNQSKLIIVAVTVVIVIILSAAAIMLQRAYNKSAEIRDAKLEWVALEIEFDPLSERDRSRAEEYIEEHEAMGEDVVKKASDWLETASNLAEQARLDEIRRLELELAAAEERRKEEERLEAERQAAEQLRQELEFEEGARRAIEEARREEAMETSCPPGFYRALAGDCRPAP